MPPKAPKTTLKKSKPEIKLKKPPVIFPSSQAELKKISDILECPILAYFKPSGTSIWSKDLYAIWEALKHIGKVEKLAVYVRSDGGSGMISLRIINLLRFFAKEIIILAPSECASAATMLALGCDEIYLGPLSSLSAVDSSLIHPLSPVDKQDNPVSVSQDELWRVLRLWTEYEEQQGVAIKPSEVAEEDLQLGFKKTSGKSFDFMDTGKKELLKDSETENPYKYLYKYIHPLVFGAIDRSRSLSIQLCKEILEYHMTDKTKIEYISQRLNNDYPSHSYPITMKEAEKIGLNVKLISEEIQDILNRLQLIYGEMTDEMITDYDNNSYHNQSVYSIIETGGVQVFYQYELDKFYRENEKRYINLNDHSSWYKTFWQTKKVATTKAKKGVEPEFTIEKIYF